MLAEIRKEKGEINDLIPGLEPNQPNIQFPRSARKVQFGIDCADIVHFSHWYSSLSREPGGEYVKYLVIKNVVMKTQKIKYKLPQTRYFSMEFPEVQTLSAGMNWTIPITFRPVAKESYDDVIEFATSFGNFSVPIKATLPEHVMEFPADIQFKYCPIRETAKFNFTLSNVGELASYYEWNIEAPFFISPSSGELDPGTSTSILIEFKPKEATVVDAIACCTFGSRENWDKSKVTKTAKVSGISKFSHLICGNTSFDFGKVNVGVCSEKKLVLKNPSPVHANFKIKNASKDNDDCFTFSALSGRVEAGSQIELDVKYTPVASGLLSNAYFDVTTLSGNTLRLTLSGEGLGPTVIVEPTVLNFNDIPSGTTVTRVFYLKNDSTSSTSFQFIIDKCSSFQLDKICGAIGPNSVIPIQVKICPVEPMNYYRKVYCLVENQDAIAIEFLATCYNEKRRPATFKYHHVTNYQKRVENGLWEYGPEQLEEMIKAETIRCTNGILEFVDPNLAREHAIVSKKDDPYERSIVSSEYFFQNTGEDLACVLVDTYVDFGSCSRYRVIEPQVIRIQNRTKGKMTCVWINNEDSLGEPTFSVSPMVADIPPKSVVEFKVFFRPKVDNEFYGKILECYCYFKSMRNFRLVNEDTFTPPWCLTPKVGGNTFPPGQDTFIPKIDWGRSRVTFTSCFVDRSEYQVLKIANAGDTTVKFSFLDIGVTTTSGGFEADFATRSNCAFSVKPRIGVLRKNETRLVLLRFCPAEKRLFEESFTCFFNNSTHSTYDLILKGHGSYPDIQFGTDNTLMFKPTCIGSVSSRKFQIRNTSKVNLNYEWQIPKHFSNLVGIHPASGRLDPDGIVDLNCTFAPTTANLHKLKIPCFYMHGVEKEAKRRSTFIVIGEGLFGQLEASPKVLDFGNLLINTLYEEEITIFNPSPCDVNYTLIAKRDESELGGSLDSQSNPTELKLIQKSHVLPARSQTSLLVQMFLKKEVPYNFGIYYILDQNQEAMSSKELPASFVQSKELHFLATATANGVHPVMSIRDIRSEGISKTILWQLFSLDRFNELLAKPSPDPNAFAEQATYADANEFNSTNVNLETMEADVNFDFGATAAGSKPTLLKMSLKNTGVVGIDWAFNFPNDFDIEIERWADPGDLTEEQAKRNFILDNNIFFISPKTGHLAPGEVVHILMSYSHEFAGPHQLPVIFRLKNGNSKAGKEILINFIGYSVPQSQKFLHLQSINHQFAPITIGSQYPPIQYYRLMNRSTMPIDYRIDTSAIENLNRENMNFEILKLRKPQGLIEPGQVDHLEFIFNPLEVKEYELDLPIIVDNGKKRIITLRGRGIDQNIDFETKSFKDPRVLPESIPQVPTLPPITNPVASISLERLDFGHVPVQALMRQVVTVSNITSDQTITVTWKIPGVWPQESIKVTPVNCCLSPGESQVFKVVFEPDELPRLYNFDLICEIVNETALAVFKQQNPTEEERLLIEGEMLHRSTTPHTKFSPLQALVKAPGPDLKKVKYKPLPGIQQGSKPPSAEDKFKTDNFFDEKPEPPAPVVYFVGIRAQSHHYDEFRQLFSRFETFYKQRKTGYPLGPTASVSDYPHMKSIFSDIVQSLLSDVFQDPVIQDLPDCLAKEPIPFYRPREEPEDVSKSKDDEIKLCPDFQNSVEMVLEGTLYNLIQEINSEEFDCTTYPMLVTNKS